MAIVHAIRPEPDSNPDPGIPAHLLANLCFGEVLADPGDGSVQVALGNGAEICCLFLLTGVTPLVKPGDQVMVAINRHGASPSQGVVLGRVGRATDACESVRIQASQSLTLSCGDAALNLTGDGRGVLKGDDVLVRAKGTHRIRAGSVSIN